MGHRKISLQVVVAVSIIVILMELLTAGIISWINIYPLTAVGIARVAEIFLMVFILRYKRNSLESVGLFANEFAQGIRKGLAWSAGFGVCALSLLGVLYFLDYNFLRIFHPPAQKSAMGIFFLLLVGGLISPVAEEIFFRGIVFGFLRKWSPVLAILGSTLAFSMAHALTSGVSVTQIAGGLLFAIAYEVEKNLLVPITIHVLGNMAIFTLPIVIAV